MSLEKTPQERTFAVENSKCFRRYAEPATGVISYILDIPRIAKNHQSIYFTQKSMTDDGRFLIFHVSNDRSSYEKELYVLDLFSGKSTKITGYTTIPFMDVKTAQVWYIREDGVFRHDLAADPGKALLLAELPRGIRELGKIKYLYTHLTLNRSRTKAFMDIGAESSYVQGMLNIDDGTFEKWGETDFYVNHGQIHPFRDDLALCAWEGLRGELVNGEYPRMWLFEPGGKKTMVPSHTNYATHEHWAEDGKGFYFCSKGVNYHELDTGRQYRISPMLSAHASLSDDNQYIAGDCCCGRWYRGCSWMIGFYNRNTDKGFHFFPELPAYNTIEEFNDLHPDPHPQFVCNDRYIISTVNLGSGNMDIAVTPVDQLIERTAN